jgi:IclR family transcriptional regulator, acetate operon repressor
VNGDSGLRSSSAGGANGVGVLQKALDVLEAIVGDGPLTLVEASKRTGLDKPAVYRILNTFEARQYMSKDPQTRRYRPGPALLGLASTVVDSIDLVRLVRPVMASLRDEFGETVNFGVVVDDHIVYVEMFESPHSLRMSSHPGSIDPLYSTALGKAILSALPVNRAKALVGGRAMVASTPHTITSWASLEADLARSRERGWAVDDEENEVGARCIAAPILGVDGVPVGALSISGPAARMTPDTVTTMAGRLCIAVDGISASVGQVPPDSSSSGPSHRRRAASGQ